MTWVALLTKCFGRLARTLMHVAFMRPNFRNAKSPQIIKGLHVVTLEASNV